MSPGYTIKNIHKSVKGVLGAWRRLSRHHRLYTAEGPTYAFALGELHEEVIFVPELLEHLDILLNQQSILQRL